MDFGGTINMNRLCSLASYSKSSAAPFSWKPVGKVQRTLAGCVEKTGNTLHSGKLTSVRIFPESAQKGRYFRLSPNVIIPASIEFATETHLCTTLSKGSFRIRTVEHLLSALEASGIDNCGIEIDIPDAEDLTAEIPILDGSACEWLKAIAEVGTREAIDSDGRTREKLAAFFDEPVALQRDDSFIAAFPSSTLTISCGIDFPEVPAIGRQWYSLSSPLNDRVYGEGIASARTFCVMEEVTRMRDAGFIKGGSLENAIVCGSSRGWLNPPLRFHDEPCRHKILDLIGDFSLLACMGSQGIPVAHIVAFKAGHSLHLDFVRRLWKGG